MLLVYLSFALIAFAVLLYVLMDGWDLGVGILFLIAPRDAERDDMMESIAPFWDGNETWLVFGGVTPLWDILEQGVAAFFLRRDRIGRTFQILVEPTVGRNQRPLILADGLRDRALTDVVSKGCPEHEI